ncbi:hypothetical protein V5F89_10830 [Pelagerythrobacter marensis]|uniref:Uncharacterized protein n=1 Tax=Pelagerythrobacter marensis TaxID=543877 RepID=A0ABZ2D182_9SPHN
MIDRPLEARRIAALIALLMGILALQACEGSKRADQTLYVCFDRSGEADRAMGLLRGISDRFGYRFREYGGQAKADLETIDANPAVIPEGKPIQADIQNGDGKVLLIASNFGSVGEDLRVSLFYHKNEGKDSAFHRAVVTGLETMEGVQLNRSAAETDANPCGEN